MRGCLGGVCMIPPGGGACVVFARGGMRGFSWGCAWFFLGACMVFARGGMCGFSPGGVRGFSRGAYMIFPGGQCVVFAGRGEGVRRI